MMRTIQLRSRPALALCLLVFAAWQLAGIAVLAQDAARPVRVEMKAAEPRPTRLDKPYRY